MTILANQFVLLLDKEVIVFNMEYKMKKRKYTLIEGLPNVNYSTFTFKDNNEQMIVPLSMLRDVKELMDKKGFIQIKPKK